MMAGCLHLPREYERPAGLLAAQQGEPQKEHPGQPQHTSNQPGRLNLGEAWNDRRQQLALGQGVDPGAQQPQPSEPGSQQLRTQQAQAE